MPPRSLTLAIVAFWLAVVGLFLIHDVWPRLAPSEPALFPVDIVDEAGQQNETVSWLVFKNGGSKLAPYGANVDWHYLAPDDTFESHCELNRLFSEKVVAELPREHGPAWLPQFHNILLGSSYLMTRGGEMTRVKTTTDYSLALPGQEKPIAVKAEVKGVPAGRRFVPHLKLTFPELKGQKKKIGPLAAEDFERDAAPVPVLEHGIVLNPLHPPRRLPDLRPGQRWAVTVIDPFAVLGLVAPLGRALGEAGLGPDAGAFVLEARVRPRAETVVWDETNGNMAGKSEVITCRVVECGGDGPVTRLAFWAREGDGLLLKQEAEVWGDTWTFWRRPSGYQMQRHPLEHP